MWRRQKLNPGSALLQKMRRRQKKVLRKPATWRDGDGAGALGSGQEQQDTSSITKQQRHVFDRCVEAGEVPSAMVELRDKIRAERKPSYPKQLNAIVNACLPKDVSYGTVIDWKSPALMEKFEKVMTHQSFKSQHVGLTWSEMTTRLGGGDMVRGEINLKKGNG